MWTGLLLITAAVHAQVARPDLGAVVRLVVAQTNTLRATQGLARTESDPKLIEAARRFAAYMAATDRYSHEADGNSPARRAQERGYEYCALSENIALMTTTAGFSTGALARGLVDGWQRSPAHRKNMLDANVTDTGVAVARTADSKRYYAVQMFGRPLSTTIEFSIVNASSGPLRYELDGKAFRIGPRVTQTHRQCSASRLTLSLGPQVVNLAPSDGRRYTVEGLEGERFRLKQD